MFYLLVLEKAFSFKRMRLDAGQHGGASVCMHVWDTPQKAGILVRETLGLLMTMNCHLSA